MYQNNIPQNRYQQQWAFLTRRMQRWLHSGEFSRFSEQKRTHLLSRLRHLFRQMLRYQTVSKLRKTLGVAAFLLGLGTLGSIQAQVEFAPPQFNPFGLVPTGEIRFETLADLDGDGDLDIVSVKYDEVNEDTQVLEFRENVGTATSPEFAAPSQGVFPSMLPQDVFEQFLNPHFADLDGDGDLDLLIGSYDTADYSGDGGILYFENTGDAENPAFGEPQVDPFGINFAGSTAVAPKTADLDGDGDLDIISLFYEFDSQSEQEEYGIVYVENTGTAMAPSFATGTRQAFNLPDQPGQILFMDFGDIDNDGDTDLLTGSVYADDYNYETPFTYYENIGDAENPNFANGVINPYNLVSTQGLFLWPMLGDLDNDGDLDVLHGGGYNPKSYETQWVYQENLLLSVDVDDVITSSDQLNVFPTVSTGLFQIQYTAPTSQEAILRVYNEAGQLITQRKVNTPFSTTSLDLGQYPAGVYYLEITQAEQRWVSNVLKQ